MSDYTANGSVHHVKRVHKAEFFLYFALIFGVALLPHIVGWLAQAAWTRQLPRLDPVTRAWKDAKAVTPMIFRG